MAPATTPPIPHSRLATAIDVENGSMPIPKLWMTGGM
jgi:hypothetical protein